MTAVDRPDNGQDEGRVTAALDELRYLTGCRCDTPWTDRGMHEPHCASDYREDVDTVASALTARAGAGEQQRDVVVAVLHAHRLTTPRQCRCGWRDDSNAFPYTTGHAEHVAGELLALLDQPQDGER